LLTVAKRRGRLLCIWLVTYRSKKKAFFNVVELGVAFEKDGGKSDLAKNPLIRNRQCDDMKAALLDCASTVKFSSENGCVL